MREVALQRLSLLLSATICIAANASAANAYYCSRPSEPSLPSGFSSNVGAMRNAESDVEDYLSDMRSYVSCLQDEITDAINEANNLQDEWNNEVSRFNSQ